MRVLEILVVVILLLGVFSLVVPIEMRVETERTTYLSYAQAPNAEVAVVLGASVVDGKPSGLLADRADAAIALYRLGKVSKILVTGDNAQSSYDEVTPVRKYLVAAAVLPEDIYLDHSGLDTYTSMYRLKHVYQASSVIIVTQDFHLPRALWLAQHLGINAYGVVARGADNSPLDYVREIPASWKALYDVLAQREPDIASSPIPLTGDGRATWTKGCALGSCPLDLAATSTGTYTYGITTRFEILLNENTDPKASFAVSCTPQGALGSVSNLPSVAPPMYYERFEGVAPGTCELSDRTFSATILVQ